MISNINSGVLDRKAHWERVYADDRRKYVEVLKRTIVRRGHVIIAAFAVRGPTKCRKGS